MNKAEKMGMDVPKTPMEEQEINKKRKTYEDALEFEEERPENIKINIKNIIRKIRGGKLSPNGELLMELDAHLENDIRDENTERIYSSKKYTNGNDALMFGGVRGEITNIKPKEILSKLQNSYLKTDLVPTGDPRDPLKAEYEIRINGVINGQDVQFIETKTSGDIRKNLVVKINGTKIADKDAEEIYEEYKDVAYAQNATIREDKLLKRLKNKQIEEDKKIAQQEALRQKTKNLVDKIKGKK